MCTGRDPASLGVVGRLARRLTGVPVIVLATARPIPRSTSLARLLAEAVPNDRRLKLGGLSNEDVAALVGAAVGGTPGEGAERLGDRQILPSG